MLLFVYFLLGTGVIIIFLLVYVRQGSYFVFILLCKTTVLFFLSNIIFVCCQARVLSSFHLHFAWFCKPGSYIRLTFCLVFSGSVLT